MFKQFSRRGAMTLEREADRIADPLERLRYLRTHAPASVGTPWEAPTGEPARSWLRKKYVLIAAALILSILASVAVVGGRASARLEREAATRGDAVEIPSAGPSPDSVWQIESSDTAEVYSNGLRVDAKLALLKTFRLELDLTYSDYRKFRAESQVIGVEEVTPHP